MDTEIRTEKLDPLEAEPPRQDGRPSGNEIDAVLREGANAWTVLAALMLALAAYDWLRWWHETLIRPVLTTVLALIVLACCVPRIVRLTKRSRRLNETRERKRETREYIDRLRESGCAVFHDLSGGDFSIDHVVLSEKGIYAVETRYLPKPFPKAQIHCDAAKVVADGLGDKSALVEQVAGNARWLKDLLKESTGRDLPVKPVIVFPDWYVLDGLQERYWVISPRALTSLMEKQERTLRSEDAHLAAYHLSRHIRTTV